MLHRLFTHCLVRPQDLPPSRDDLTVIGTFNPGAAALGDQIVLLVRVVEQPQPRRAGYTALPRYERGGIVIDEVADEELEMLDPRVVRRRSDGLIRLTFISHLRVFRGPLSDPARVAADPVRFEAAGEYESFGVEDARITRIGNRFWITYVSVSPHGACTSLASTSDFRRFDRHGVIFPPENKDVLLFPQRIGGRFMAMHRPNPAYKFSPPEMWLGYSDDLIHWGGHRRLLGGSGATWSSGRIGGGCPPIRTERGWLEIYHGNAAPPGGKAAGVGAYLAAAFMMDAEDPSHIIGYSDGPILAPDADFERLGFLPDIIFPTGIIEEGRAVLIYYGAADAHTGVVGVERDELVETCTVR